VFRIAKFFVAMAGFAIAFVGLLAGALYLLPSLIRGDGLDVVSSTVSASLIVLSLGLGLPLAWQGVNSLRGRPSRRFRPGPSRLLVAIFVVVVILGQVVLAFDLLPELTFPPFYILGAVLPALFLLAFVGRRVAEDDVRWREVVLQLASGAFLSTFGSLSLEAMLGLLTMVIVVALTALTPGGAAWLQELSARLQDPTWFQNPENAYNILISPPALITLALAVLVIAPLTEEMFKSLGVVIMSYRRPSKARAFLWGLASGAGFAVAEGLFSGSLSLDGWGQTTILRVGAAAMHCLGGGLMGLGWHYLFATRRPWRLLGAYAASAGLHSLWNVGSFGMAVVSFSIVSSTADKVGLVFGGLIALGLMVFLSLLALSTILIIIYLTKWLRNYSLTQLDKAPEFPQVPLSSLEYQEELWEIQGNSGEF